MASQLAFPTESKRTAVRAFGLQGLGKLKPCKVPMANGLHATAYYVSKADGHLEEQFVAIVHPKRPHPLWARKVNEMVDGKRKWGDWKACHPPEELHGFRSERPNPLTDRQYQWWKSRAKDFGLDPDAKVDAKMFCVLPVLRDLGVSIQ